MKEVNFNGAPISPTQLDVKQHSNKTLSELHMLLQTASTLKGAVTSVSKTGDVIFTTIHGKFSAQLQTPLADTLNKGDKIVLKTEISDAQLLGNIITINGNSIKGMKPVTLKLVESTAMFESAKGKAAVENVAVSAPKIEGTSFKAVISYLSLSNINKNSALGRVLAPTTNGSHLELKVVANNTAPKTPYSLTCEVIASDSDKQMIKTPFGILTSNSDQNLPVGKKLQLEIKAVENKPVDNITIPAKVEDFIFKLNDNSHLLKNLFGNIKSNDFSQNSQTKSNVTVTDQSNSSISRMVKEQIISGLVNADNKPIVSRLLQSEPQLTTLMDKLQVSTTLALIAKLNLMAPEKLTEILTTKDFSQESITASARASDYKSSALQDQEDDKQTLKLNSVIEKLLETPKQKEIILKLSEDFNKIKELLSFNVREDENNKWQNFFIPIYDGERVTQNKVSIHKKPNQYIRFIVELAFEEIGNIQLDGLVKLKPDTNIPENFDLTVRFKNKLSRDFQAQIFEIYKISQAISGIKGGLDFENVHDFSNEAIDLL